MSDQNGSPMSLPDRVRAAKRAARAAGFSSGHFKPNGNDLRLDVTVQVTFPNATFMCTDDAMREHVWEQIRGTCLINKGNQRESNPNFVPAYKVGLPVRPTPVASESLDPRPADMRTLAGREWKLRNRQYQQNKAVAQ